MIKWREIRDFLNPISQTSINPIYNINTIYLKESVKTRRKASKGFYVERSTCFYVVIYTTNLKCPDIVDSLKFYRC